MTEPESFPKNIMMQLQQLQSQLLEAQSVLAEEIVVGVSEGETVKVTLSGDQRALSVLIDPEVVAANDVDMLQELLMTALNNALDESRKLAGNHLGPLSAQLSIG